MASVFCTLNKDNSHSHRHGTPTRTPLSMLKHWTNNMSDKRFMIKMVRCNAKSQAVSIEFK